MNEEYEGIERRKNQLQLQEALAEVQRLNQAATLLADAVAKTAHRSELDALKLEVEKEFKQKVLINAALSLAIIVLLGIFINVKMNNLREDVNKSHAVITCLQGKTEAQRTADLAATALVTCEQSAR